MYLLDTNIISYWMRGDKRVIGRIKKHAPSDLSLSTITLAEILFCGQSLTPDFWRLISEPQSVSHLCAQADDRPVHPLRAAAAPGTHQPDRRCTGRHLCGPAHRVPVPK